MGLGFFDSVAHSTILLSEITYLNYVFQIDVLIVPLMCHDNIVWKKDIILGEIHQD